MEVAQFDPKVYELEVLSFWKEHRCYPKAKEKVRGSQEVLFPRRPAVYQRKDPHRPCLEQVAQGPVHQVQTDAGF